MSATDIARRVDLAPGVASELRAAARAAYPLEACGALLGRARDLDTGTVEVRAQVVIPNVAADLAERFELDPGAVVAAEDRARRRGLELVGFWHSHPDAPARPSAADARSSARGGWVGWPMLIVSVRDGAARELRGWRFRADGAPAELALETFNASLQRRDVCRP